MSEKSKVALQNLAVKAALHSDWGEAVKYNNEILEQYPEDIPTLNRLGFALTHMGSLKEAKATFEQVLAIDKYNPIAQKNLHKLTLLKPGTVIKKNSDNRIKTSFIEEPGKTKTIVLVRPGTSKTLLSVTTGMGVNLVPKKRRVCVETSDGEYIGCIPDDIGLRLERLLKLGYEYETNIKAIQDKHICVFVKEINRATGAKNMPSFPGNSTHAHSDKITSNSLHDIPIDITPTGEELPMEG